MTQIKARRACKTVFHHPMFRVLPVAVLGVALFALTSPQSTQAEPTRAEIAKLAKNLRVGADPINFTAVVHGTGTEFQLSDLKGKVVLLDFWATWCGPCIREMPNVKKVYADFHDQGLEIIGISLDNDVKALDRYVEKEEIYWPQVADGKGWSARLAQYYEVNSIPRTYLIGRDGKIAAVNPRGSKLRPAIAKAIAAKP